MDTTIAMDESEVIPSGRQHRIRQFGIDCGDGLEWSGGSWKPGGEYVKRLTVKNVSTVLRRVRYKLPKTKFFSMEFPETLRLAPGNHVQLEVRFRPIRLEEYHDVIIFSTENGDFQVPIHARLSRLAVQVPNELALGLCPVNETCTHQITILNAGEIAADFQWEVPAPFWLEPSQGTIQPRQRTTITVFCQPGSANVFESMAICSVRQSSTPTEGVRFTDTAVTAENTLERHVMRLQAIGKYQFISLSENTVDFGKVLVTSDGHPLHKYVELTNMSSVPATITVSRIDHDRAPEFSVTPATTVIGPNESTRLQLSFRARTHGLYSCERFFLMTPGGNVLTLTARALAHGPIVILTRKDPAGTEHKHKERDSSFSFGDVYLPPTGVAALGKVNSDEKSNEAAGRTHVMTLRNYSNTTAYFAFDTPGTGIFRLSKPKGEIAPLLSTEVVVAFRPTAPGNYYRRLVCHVKDSVPLIADVFGSAYDDKTRPFPIRELHIDAYRLLPPAVRLLAPHELLGLMQRLVQNTRSTDVANYEGAMLEADSNTKPITPFSATSSLFLRDTVSLNNDEQEPLWPVSPDHEDAESFDAALEGVTHDMAIKRVQSTRIRHWILSLNTLLHEREFDLFAPEIAAARATRVIGALRATTASLGKSLRTQHGNASYSSKDILPVEQIAKLSNSTVSDLPEGYCQVMTRSGDTDRASAAIQAEIFGDTHLNEQTVVLSASTLDFGTGSRTMINSSQTLQVINRARCKMTVRVVLPVSTTSPDASTSDMIDDDSNRGNLWLLSAQGTHDWHVSRTSFDIDAGASADLLVSFRPTADDIYYADELELYISPKINRNFRLVDEESFTPPICHRVQLLGHTFKSTEHFVPRLDPQLKPSIADSLAKRAYLDGVRHVEMPSCFVGDAVYTTLELRNQGDTPATFQFTETYSSNATFQVQPCQGKVDAGSFALVMIRFMPQHQRVYHHTFQLVMNESPDHALQIHVAGTAALPQLELEQLSTPNTVFIKPTCIGVTSQSTFRLRNPTRVPVRFQWQLEGASSVQFDIKPASGILLGNDTIETMIRFAPTRKGAAHIQARCIALPAGSLDEEWQRISIVADAFLPQNINPKSPSLLLQDDSNARTEFPENRTSAEHKTSAVDMLQVAPASSLRMLSDIISQYCTKDLENDFMTDIVNNSSVLIGNAHTDDIVAGNTAAQIQPLQSLVLNVETEAGPGVLRFSPPSLNFGQLLVSGTRNQTFVVENCSDCAVFFRLGVHVDAFMQSFDDATCATAVMDETHTTNSEEAAKHIANCYTFTPKESVLQPHSSVSVSVAFTAQYAWRYVARVFYEILDRPSAHFGVQSVQESTNEERPDMYSRSGRRKSLSVVTQNISRVEAEKAAEGLAKNMAQGQLIRMDDVPTNQNPLWCEIVANGVYPQIVIEDIRALKSAESLLTTFSQPPRRSDIDMLVPLFSADPHISATSPAKRLGGSMRPSFSIPNGISSDRSHGVGETVEDSNVAESEVATHSLYLNRGRDGIAFLSTQRGNEFTLSHDRSTSIAVGGDKEGGWLFLASTGIDGDVHPLLLPAAHSENTAQFQAVVSNTANISSQATENNEQERSPQTNKTNSDAHDFFANSAASSAILKFLGLQPSHVPNTLTVQARLHPTAGSVARLWDQFALKRLNEVLSKPLNAREREFNEATRAVDSAEYLETIQCEFTPAVLGSAPDCLILSVRNSGSLPVSFDIRFEHETDIDVEPWVANAEPSEKEMKLRQLTDRHVFGIYPRRATIPPGEAVSVCFYYAYVSTVNAGHHTVPVILRVHKGKQVRLMLRGQTLDAAVPCLRLDSCEGTKLLRPVPVGCMDPIRQAIQVYNPSAVDIAFAIDKSSLLKLQTENQGFAILDVSFKPPFNYTFDANTTSGSFCKSPTTTTTTSSSIQGINDDTLIDQVLAGRTKSEQYQTPEHVGIIPAKGETTIYVTFRPLQPETYTCKLCLVYTYAAFFAERTRLQLLSTDMSCRSSSNPPSTTNLVSKQTKLEKSSNTVQQKQNYIQSTNISQQKDQTMPQEAMSDSRQRALNIMRAHLLSVDPTGEIFQLPVHSLQHSNGAKSHQSMSSPHTTPTNMCEKVSLPITLVGSGVTSITLVGIGYHPDKLRAREMTLTDPRGVPCHGRGAGILVDGYTMDILPKFIHKNTPQKIFRDVIIDDVIRGQQTDFWPTISNQGIMSDGRLVHTYKARTMDDGMDDQFLVPHAVQYPHVTAKLMSNNTSAIQYNPKLKTQALRSSVVEMEWNQLQGIVPNTILEQQKLQRSVFTQLVTTVSMLQIQRSTNKWGYYRSTNIVSNLNSETLKNENSRQAKSNELKQSHIEDESEQTYKQHQQTYKQHQQTYKQHQQTNKQDQQANPIEFNSNKSANHSDMNKVLVHRSAIVYRPTEGVAAYPGAVAPNRRFTAMPKPWFPEGYVNVSGESIEFGDIPVTATTQRILVLHNARNPEALQEAICKDHIRRAKALAAEKSEQQDAMAHAQMTYGGGALSTTNIEENMQSGQVGQTDKMQLNNTSSGKHQRLLLRGEEYILMTERNVGDGSGPVLFEFDATHPLVAAGIIKISPSKGSIAPGSTVVIRMMLNAPSIPQSIDSNIAMAIGLTHAELVFHAAQIAHNTRRRSRRTGNRGTNPPGNKSRGVSLDSISVRSKSKKPVRAPSSSRQLNALDQPSSSVHSMSTTIQGLPKSNNLAPDPVHVSVAAKSTYSRNRHIEEHHKELFLKRRRQAHSKNTLLSTGKTIMRHSTRSPSHSPMNALSSSQTMERKLSEEETQLSEQQKHEIMQSTQEAINTSTVQIGGGFEIGSHDAVDMLIGRAMSALATSSMLAPVPVLNPIVATCIVTDLRSLVGIASAVSISQQADTQSGNKQLPHMSDIRRQTIIPLATAERHGDGLDTGYNSMTQIPVDSVYTREAALKQLLRFNPNGVYGAFQGDDNESVRAQFGSEMVGSLLHDSISSSTMNDPSHDATNVALKSQLKIHDQKRVSQQRDGQQRMLMSNPRQSVVSMAGAQSQSVTTRYSGGSPSTIVRRQAIQDPASETLQFVNLSGVPRARLFLHVSARICSDAEFIQTHGYLRSFSFRKPAVSIPSTLYSPAASWNNSEVAYAPRMLASHILQQDSAVNGGAKHLSNNSDKKMSDQDSIDRDNIDVYSILPSASSPDEILRTSEPIQNSDTDLLADILTNMLSELISDETTIMNALASDVTPCQAGNKLSSSGNSNDTCVTNHSNSNDENDTLEHKENEDSLELMKARQVALQEEEAIELIGRCLESTIFSICRQVLVDGDSFEG